ncbi:response regulator [Aquincola sp. S2]|uniref:Response regulator n=1 Tax=Pseudaquabacterium terrae TaxID=2732868 RepID=A0ABX2ERB4_9BURK|nr:response regulator [Aquabacterium terrae]NRF71099.1 response regulator [Aquabacterium terrae]
MARILVIEDNPENLDLMVYLLRAFGHEPLAAQSGEEGLLLAQRERPDLVLCDIHMPRLDGFGVLQRLRADPALARVRCVAVTALAMLGDRAKVLAAGFDDYLSKPIEPERFVGQVETFLGLAPHENTAVEAPSPAPPHPSPGRRAVVLVIDDSATNRNLIECTLRPFGYQVTLADSVAAGLQAARAQRPDLILSDMHMPGQDGMSLLESVKADPALATIPFVFITSSVYGDKDEREALDKGAARFLLRPIEPQALLRELAALLPPSEPRHS